MNTPELITNQHRVTNKLGEFTLLLATDKLTSHTLTTGWRPTEETLATCIQDIPASFLRFVSRLTGDQDAAEDCIQEGALEVLDHFDQCRATTEAEFRAWFRRIVINKAKLFNRNRLRLRTSSIEKFAATLTSEASGNVEFYVAVEMAEQVKRVVKTYPPGQQEAFLLRFVGEWTIQAISERLGKSPDTISVWLKRMRERIRKRLGNDSPLT
jgi:RNA polymerase sigma factor (sigma-70 family)